MLISLFKQLEYKISFLDLKKLIKYEQSKEKKAQIAQEKVSVACETSLPFEAVGGNSRHAAASPSLGHENYFTHPCPPVTKPGSPNLQRSYHSEDFGLFCK